MKYRLSLCFICLLYACVGQANDFPTLDRVEYVYKCMKEHGKETYDNLYACVCAIDEIAKQMPYEDYAEAIAFVQLFSTPGERGSMFRDPPRSDELRDKLEQINAAAEKKCFLKNGS